MYTELSPVTYAGRVGSSNERYDEYGEECMYHTLPWKYAYEWLFL